MTFHYIARSLVHPPPFSLRAMLRNPSAKESTFQGRVAASDLALLDRFCPSAGFRTWLFRSALHEFNAQLAAHPELADPIHERIHAMVQDPQKLRGGAAVQVRIASSEYDAFNAVFPEYGATSWFLRRILSTFIAAIQGYPLMSNLTSEALASLLYQPEPTEEVK